MEKDENIKYGMTLRELLLVCDFDKIAELVKLDKQFHDHVEAFREAYDILLQTKSSEEGCYRIEVRWYEQMPYEGEGRILFASRIEGLPWDQLIDGDIYIADVNIKEEPKELLAYRLLWHLTFYGFTPKDQKETWYEMMNGGYPRNNYGEMAREIDLKRDMLFATPTIRRRIISSIKELAKLGEIEYGLTEEDWNVINHRKAHCNRAKRMRDHRLEIRRNALMEIAKKTPQSPIENYHYNYNIRHWESITQYKSKGISW